MGSKHIYPLTASKGCGAIMLVFDAQADDYKGIHGCRTAKDGSQKPFWRASLLSRIEDHLLERVFYLYPSLASAKAGDHVGASGFFVSKESSVPGHRHVYAVTNKHNILECRETVCVRARSIRQETFYIESDPVDWFVWPKYDLALLPINDDDAARLPEIDNMLFTKADVDEYGIGPGDRVFMIGRFVYHDGGRENIPSVRFGHISTMPGAIRHPKNFQDLSWGVEMRSISGYSGSPVFLYWGHMDMDRGGKKRDNTQAMLGCLGVDWGHLPDRWPVLSKDGKNHPDGLTVRSSNAMCGIVPSWDLQWCLDSKELAEQRSVAEGRQSLNPAVAVLDFSEPAESSPPSSDANPTHREDFMRLVGAATRKPEPKD